MRALPRTTAAFGAAGLVAAGLVATASPAAANHTYVIKVTEIETDFDSSFDEDEVPEVGDTFSFESNLRQNGKRVGTDAGDCKIRRILGDEDDPDGMVVRCVVWLRFFDTGSVKVVGKVNVDFSEDFPTFSLPVRDGTGKFRDAEGTLTVKQVGDTKSRLTLRMTGVRH